jgi:hypothetical protein
MSRNKIQASSILINCVKKAESKGTKKKWKKVNDGGKKLNFYLLFSIFLYFFRVGAKDMPFVAVRCIFSKLVSSGLGASY